MKWRARQGAKSKDGQKRREKESIPVRIREEILTSVNLMEYFVSTHKDGLEHFPRELKQ